MARYTEFDVDRGSLAYFTVELDNTHPVPAFWADRLGLEDLSTGHARVLINLDTKQIYKMEMVVDGMYASGDPGTQNLLQRNIFLDDTDRPLQPFHFHNVPQGGDKFFVQQLFDVDQQAREITTASLENTDTGFRFAIDEPYTLRAPVNGADRAQFVIPEILDGKGYLGIHTEDFKVGATAIAGTINVFGNGTMDGKIKWYGDTSDFGFGSRKNDLLSLGGGDDRAFGRSGNDVIDGGDGSDRLFGNRGDDDIWGGDDDDFLFGGTGDDNLFGNRGNDLLVGGFGDDTLTGGADNDIFRFGLFSGSDTITDFVESEDELQFVGFQRVLGAQLADLDGDLVADDTLLTLIGGDVAVLNVDLTSDFIV